MDELLRLTKENNAMLKQILYYVQGHHDDEKDFTMNLIANLLSNRIDGRFAFGV